MKTKTKIINKLKEDKLMKTINKLADVDTLDAFINGLTLLTHKHGIILDTLRIRRLDRGEIDPKYRYTAEPRLRRDPADGQWYLDSEHTIVRWDGC